MGADEYFVRNLVPAVVTEYGLASRHGCDLRGGELAIEDEGSFLGVQGEGFLLSLEPAVAGNLSGQVQYFVRGLRHDLAQHGPASEVVGQPAFALFHRLLLGGIIGRVSVPQGDHLGSRFMDLHPVPRLEGSGRIAGLAFHSEGDLVVIRHLDFQGRIGLEVNFLVGAVNA